MLYVDKRRRVSYLFIGFAAMLLCGFSDDLLSFMGEGEPYLFSGLLSMNVTDVPLWYYQISFGIGIFAAIGYLLASRSVCSYICDQLQGEKTRCYKAYTFGTSMMSVGIFGIHTICCLALMNIRAAVNVGLSADAIENSFKASTLYPFIVGTIWQTTADIISGIAYMTFVCRKVINVPKRWLLIGPLCFYVICKFLGLILMKITGNALFQHLCSGGESWGIAFMFLAVLAACKKGKE